jgi:hypothetical protein
MRSKTLFTAAVVFGLVLCGFYLTSKAPSTMAKTWGWTNGDLWGGYAVYFSGTVVLPAGHPLSALNGPCSMVGRVFFDGEGNVKGTVYTTFNGSVSPGSWEGGTYTVNNDGTMKITVTAEILLAGSQKLTFECYGIVYDEGKQIKLVFTKIGGLQLPENYVGMTSVGTLVRQ